jgi:Tfp pilus assembly protein PilV
MKIINKKNKTSSSGFGLIEVVIGAAIISISLFGIVSLFGKSIQISREIGKKVQAGFLLEEGAEAVRIMRDSSWSNISTLNNSTDYYLVFANGTWATSTVNTFIDGKFERKFTLSDVYRDGNDDIAPSGTLDTGIKKVNISVSWFGKNATTTESVSLYLANIFE